MSSDKDDDPKANAQSSGSNRRPRKTPEEREQIRQRTLKELRKRQALLRKNGTEGFNQVQVDGRINGPANRRLTKFKDYLIGDLIIDRVAHGETLYSVVKNTPGMPNWTTVMRWQAANLHNFADRLAEAKRLQAEVWADNMIDEIANNDDMDPRDKRVRADIHMKIMERNHPNRWGMRQIISGDQNNPLFNINVVMPDLAALSDDQLAALQAFTEATQEAKQASGSPPPRRMRQIPPTVDAEYRDVTPAAPSLADAPEPDPEQ